MHKIESQRKRALDLGKSALYQRIKKLERVLLKGIYAIEEMREIDLFIPEALIEFEETACKLMEVEND